MVYASERARARQRRRRRRRRRRRSDWRTVELVPVAPPQIELLLN